MKNNLAVAVIGLALVVGGFGWWIATTPKVASNLNKEAGTTTSQKIASENKLSLQDLISSKKSQKCVVKQSSGVATSEGVVYTAGGKIRGDFSSLSAGQKVTTHLIIANNLTYTWIDGLPTGFKAPVAVDAKSLGAASQGVDIDQELDYDCSPWSPDQSLFNLPKNVQFLGL